MKILRYVVVDDCGTVINPMVVEGQVHGGGAHGVGNALLEEVAYDAAGQLATFSGSVRELEFVYPVLHALVWPCWVEQEAFLVAMSGGCGPPHLRKQLDQRAMKSWT